MLLGSSKVLRSQSSRLSLVGVVFPRRQYVYFILKRLAGSQPGAAVGAMLFASEAVFADIYWCFCTVFELVATFFSLIGILLWTSERRGWWRVVLASLILLLAMKGKEMAITVALVWLSYDLLLRKDMKWRRAVHWALPSGLAFWYGLAKRWRWEESQVIPII